MDTQPTGQNDAQNSLAQENSAEKKTGAETGKIENPQVWGHAGNLETISAQDAQNKILAGQPLENIAVPEIILSGVEIRMPIVIKNCHIGKLNLLGASVHENLTIERCVIDTALFSQTNRRDQPKGETVFKGKVCVKESQISGETLCVNARWSNECIWQVKFIGKANFSESCFENSANWNYSIFMEDFECVHSNFTNKETAVWGQNMLCHKNVLFRRCSFHFKINFKFSTFKGNTFFTDCVFHQRAGFNNIVSEGTFEFDRSTLDEEFSSRNASYNDVSWRACYLRDNMFLQNSKFNGKMVITRGNLHGDIVATEIHCGKKAELDESVFGKEVNFRSANFAGDFFCRNATLGKPESQVDFSSVRFEKDADFEESKLPATADFANAVFCGKTSFNKAILGSSKTAVSFKNSQFQRRASFGNAHFLAKAIFNGSTFTGRTGFERAIFDDMASFVEVKFGEENSFQDAQFLRQAFFYKSQLPNTSFIGAEFAGPAHFAIEHYIAHEDQQPAEFSGETIFINTRFLKQAIFQKVTFKGKVKFNTAYFAEQTSFRQAHFCELVYFGGVFCSLELDLREIKADKELRLKGANVSCRLNLADAQFQTISFYNMVTDLMTVSLEQLEGKMRGEITESKDPMELRRTSEEFVILKKNFAIQGMHKEEDWAYNNFRRYLRRSSSLEAKQKKKWLTLLRNGLEKILLDWGTQYGTHPIRLTVLAFFIMLGFGCFYYFCPQQFVLNGNEITNTALAPTLGQCVYFSIMSFTTMGFGEIRPHFYGWLKYVVAFEALLGIMIMTLFVSTYARKIIR